VRAGDAGHAQERERAQGTGEWGHELARIHFDGAEVAVRG